MPNRVVHFEIGAKDAKRASKFYSEAFGWDMQQQGEEYGNYILANTGPQGLPKEAKDMGISGGIFQEQDTKYNAYRCVIGVEDIEKAMEDVKKAGGKLLAEKPTDIPKVGLYLECQDTEGNYFTLLQPSGDMM